MIILNVRKAVTLITAIFLASCTATAFASELREAKADPARDLFLGDFFGTCSEDRCGTGFLGIGNRKKIHLVSDTGICEELCTQFLVFTRVFLGEWECGPCVEDLLPEGCFSIKPQDLTSIDDNKVNLVFVGSGFENEPAGC